MKYRLLVSDEAYWDMVETTFGVFHGSSNPNSWEGRLNR